MRSAIPQPAGVPAEQGRRGWIRNWLLIAAAETFGLAIVGAAFLLSWAAEVLKLDVSQGLALGLLAPIAIFPDYIVDATFAWRAAHEPAYAEYAVTIMTGAERGA